MSYLLNYAIWKNLHEAVTAYVPKSDVEISSSADPTIDTNLQKLIDLIQAEFGKPIRITSAARDPKRNAKIGGAKNSAHMRNNAADITFEKNIDDTLKFVEIASKLGAGGIGVYSAGVVHVDLEGRRAWGKGFTSKGIPDWAKDTLKKHVNGDFSENKKVVPTVISPNIIKGATSIEIPEPLASPSQTTAAAVTSSKSPTIGDVLSQMKEIQNGTRVLKKGDTGETVLLVSHRLKQLGYISNSPKTTFDTEVETALKDFQTTAGIPANGTFGKDSFRELYGSELKKGSAKPNVSVVAGAVKTTHTGDKAKNINLLISEMVANGITNPHAQIGILSTIGKESSFIPVSEYSYSTTSNARLRHLFGRHLSKYSEEELDKLKKDDVAFYDAIYGPGAKRSWNTGNTNPGDGYKYRGRGFNQITFKTTYKKYGDLLGIDLVANPDLLNDPKIAAKAAVVFLLSGAKRMGLDPNKFTDTPSAIHTFVQINAGRRTDMTNSESYTNAIRASSKFVIDPNYSA